MDSNLNMFSYQYKNSHYKGKMVLRQSYINIIGILFHDELKCIIFIPLPNEVGGGGILDSPCPSVRLSVCPSVCRRHSFRSISQVCFGISILNFICMLMVFIGKSLFIFSEVTFKMAAWWPYWIFRLPDSDFSLALNINSKLKWHNTYVYV